MKDGVSELMSAEAFRVGVRRRRCRLPVVAATGGDHVSVYYFLRDVFHGHTREEFNASLENPFYEPSDRLLIRHGIRIASHVHMLHRTMQFGPLQLPVSMLGSLATLPECRGRGQGSLLLAEAQRRMARSGALIGLLSTSIPHFFHGTGWALCGRHSYSSADVRSVLAGLIDRGYLRRRRPRFQIRPWRQWELDALVRIYNQNLHDTYGSVERTGAYWKWLMRRQGYDQFYVALEGPNLLELGETNTRIVGYAVTRGEAIVELATSPDRRGAAAELIGRCCGDAIELNRNGVVIHAPQSSSVHKLLCRAGGVHHCRESDHGEVFMARLLNPLKLLRQLLVEFSRRADQACLPLPIEFGLAVDRKRYNIELTGSGSKVLSRKLGHNYLRLNVADFTRLVLGQLDWSAAFSDGRVEPSTEQAGQIGPVLFPPLPLWRPPFDDLPAS